MHFIKLLISLYSSEMLPNTNIPSSVPLSIYTHSLFCKHDDCDVLCVIQCEFACILPNVIDHSTKWCGTTYYPMLTLPSQHLLINIDITQSAGSKLRTSYLLYPTLLTCLWDAFFSGGKIRNLFCFQLGKLIIRENFLKRISVLQ